jgi:hypothetical protein
VNTEDDIVEEYLDELFVALRGQPRQVRRMLAETEEHLRLTIIDDLARGTPAEDATVAAVARFGGAAEVARAWNASTPAEPMPTFLRRLAAQLVPLAGTGLIAIGLSGVIARIMTALWGRTFMFADHPARPTRLRPVAPGCPSTHPPGVAPTPTSPKPKPMAFSPATPRESLDSFCSAWWSSSAGGADCRSLAA